ncbi:MAG: antitoxin family protein [Pseudomonadota bacterium]
MVRNIEAVYEGGVLKPLSPLKLKENEKVTITIEERESIVRATSGIFGGLDDTTINDVALSPEYLPDEA